MSDLLQPASCSQYLRAQASSIHCKWISCLRDLRQVTHPASRQIYLDDLQDLYKQATALYSRLGEHFDHISRSQLLHIVNRSLDHHISIAKNIETVVSCF